MKRQAFTVLFTALISTTVLAQKVDSLQKKHIDYLKKNLSITDAKAQQVAAIMDAYKNKAKVLSSNMSLNENDKRSQFDALIAEKNSKLEKILDDKQLDKVVPTSERKFKSSKK